MENQYLRVRHPSSNPVRALALIPQPRNRAQRRANRLFRLSASRARQQLAIAYAEALAAASVPVPVPENSDEYYEDEGIYDEPPVDNVEEPIPHTNGYAIPPGPMAFMPEPPVNANDPPPVVGNGPVATAGWRPWGALAHPPPVFVLPCGTCGCCRVGRPC